MKRSLGLCLLLLVIALLVACGTPTAGGLLFRTADPSVAVFMPIAQPTAVATVAATEVPTEVATVAPTEVATVEPTPVEVGTAMPEPTPLPPCIVVKGNISRDGRKLYHIEGMANFKTVKIDEAAGERFFCSEAEAIAAGWTKAGN